jgi:hypothetical protein
MYYKNFDQHITRKHGIVIEGWPLRTFDNPSAIGSQVELKVLLGSWETGATRFRKMSVQEHMTWMENHAESEPIPTIMDQPALITMDDPALMLSPFQHDDPGFTLATIPPADLQQPFNTIDFQSASPAPTSINPTHGAPKRARKVRSDKGKPRKKAKASQIPGAGVFHTDAP